MEWDSQVDIWSIGVMVRLKVYADSIFSNICCLTNLMEALSNKPSEPRLLSFPKHLKLWDYVISHVWSELGDGLDVELS
jgi:hypothetical protein